MWSSPLLQVRRRELGVVKQLAKAVELGFPFCSHALSRLTCCLCTYAFGTRSSCAPSAHHYWVFSPNNSQDLSNNCCMTGLFLSFCVWGFLALPELKSTCLIVVILKLYMEKYESLWWLHVDMSLCSCPKIFFYSLRGEFPPCSWPGMQLTDLIIYQCHGGFSWAECDMAAGSESWAISGIPGVSSRFCWALPSVVCTAALTKSCLWTLRSVFGWSCNRVCVTLGHFSSAIWESWTGDVPYEELVH